MSDNSNLNIYKDFLKKFKNKPDEVIKVCCELLKIDKEEMEKLIIDKYTEKPKENSINEKNIELFDFVGIHKDKEVFLDENNVLWDNNINIIGFYKNNEYIFYDEQNEKIKEDIEKGKKIINSFKL